MDFTSEQLQTLRKPFEKIGAFEGRSEEEILKILRGIAEIYITLAQINLNNK